MKKLKLLAHILVIKLIIKNFLRWIIGVSFEEEKKLKGIGQSIFVANHNSHLDTACFLSIIPAEKFLTTHPIAAKDYFSKNGLFEIFVKFIFNVILIDRKNREEALRAIKETLDEGHSILFFPEGSRGNPEVLGEFKSGIGVLIKEHPHIPFVPIFMRGLGKAMPKGDPMLIPHEGKIIIGEPILIENPGNYSNAEITQMVRQAILNLSSP